MKLGYAITCIIAIVLTGSLLAACGGGSSAQDASQKGSNSLQNQVYQSKHNIEFRNYNLRQKISDDPATIMWCTFFPPTVGQQPFTVPIAGKLTSSNKRPYAGTHTADNGTPGTEVPGPDHMFGTSEPYRYGFDPTLTTYYDFTDLPSFCTNQPTVWQQNKTQIVVDESTTLGAASGQASAAIKAGKTASAATILKKASQQGVGK
jgi:hypothetical protein